MNTKLQHFKNVSSGVYEIALLGEIGWDCSGADIFREIKYINDYNLGTEINILINSVGGSIVDGLNVVGAIYTSKIPVNTYNIGIAASMSGIIAACGARRKAADYSNMMLHEPRIFDQTIDEIEDENTRKAMIMFRDQLVTILSKNCRKEKEEIYSILKAETWYNAEQAKEAGFVDEIEAYSTRPFLRDEMPVSAKLHMIAAFWDKQKSNNLKTENMFKEVKAHLNLNEDAAEKSVLEAVKNIQLEKETAENKVAELSLIVDAAKVEADTMKADLTAKENELSALKEVVNTIEAAKVEAINASIEAEVKAMKFDVEKEPRMIELAKANYDMFKEIVKSMPVVAPIITNQLEVDEPQEGELTDAEDKAADEYNKLDRENPAELAAIESSDKARFAKMVSAYAKKYLK